MEQNIQIENLCRILRREAALLPQGGRLPAVREIVRRYGTHRGIVDAALKRLEEERLIVRRKRIGIFSRLASSSVDLRALFCYVDWNAPNSMWEVTPAGSSLCARFTRRTLLTGSIPPDMMR